MSDITTAFWGMTINNYDETDLALVRQGYPDYIRQIVYTLEEGESGTPHIQAYLKLYRQQRLSYVKKLFPRGNFKALTNDEYKLNAQRYAQKLDGTAQSPATITNNPFPDAINELMSVLEGALKWWGDDDRSWVDYKEKEWLQMIKVEQYSRVKEKPHLAKFYISAQYKTIVKEYLMAVVDHVFSQKYLNTHTHTHGDEKFSVAEDIKQDEGDFSQGLQHETDDTEGREGEDDESDQDSETSETEGFSESGSVSSSSSHDF